MALVITHTDKTDHDKRQSLLPRQNQRQLEKLATNEDSLFQGYLKGDGTFDLEKLSDADDVNLKMMFAELDELEAGEELS